ncbi:uncharacterized protein AB675_7363 [Cyphellophora attinorum]|uniref:Uncharacterized protein n=1 Tax=Cyphellophora attinorum TaxID=1664694 RepID=A0A0N1HJ49_9EURO|nr:uncharacterized protein AB675_7363 [Phialophora attinorum]KPI36356.1 hypothetical protein AB675_7363 [Phialophora attinorum]
METITTDYLVVGAGAMGLAFVDTLLTETKATISLVDRYAQPGGHWTIAYPFVRLHQSSAHYGVNSRILGDRKIDKIGWNEGLASLAPGAEVVAYFQHVVHDTFLPSGRVRYFNKHEYLGDGRFKSLATGKAYNVGEATKIVDATYMRTEVPSMREPPFKVADGVDVIPPNDLVKLSRPYGHYTVVGAGKTGIDACLYLLDAEISPSQISWILPRDPWYFNRNNFQTGEEFRERILAAGARSTEAIMAATDTRDLLHRLESAAHLTRLDPSVEPEAWKCATISLKELDAIRSIPKSNITRKGHVTLITANKVTLDNGTYVPDADTLYVDCSAGSIPKRPIVPIFNGRHITLQAVRFCQQVFSAAVIARVEAVYTAEAFKNELCTPIPMPNHPNEYVRGYLQTYRNEILWASEEKMKAWLGASRLNVAASRMPKPPEDPKARVEFNKKMREKLVMQIEKLEKLMRADPDREHWTGVEEDMHQARL